MVDFFYKQIIGFSKIKKPLFSLLRAVVSLIANLILPVYYLLSSKKVHCCQEDSPIIVSLTSYPARIKKTWLAVESIFHQTFKPSKIILWLSCDQFPDGLCGLPKRLIKQVSRGLDIQFVDGNIRSHKKYYYCFQKHPNDIVFLIDDDIFYPSDILRKSYTLFQKRKDCVVANFGFRYKWNDNNSYIEIIRDEFSSTENVKVFFGTGGGTMLVPLGLMSFIDSLDEIMNICPTADDIYLNGIVCLANKPVMFSSNSPLLTIREKGSSLLSENGSIGNDTSRNAEQLYAFVSHCMHKYGKNPFSC